MDGSPYHLRLRSQPSQEQVVPPALPPPIDPPRATIEPIEFYVSCTSELPLVVDTNIRSILHLSSPFVQLFHVLFFKRIFKHPKEISIYQLQFINPPNQVKDFSFNATNTRAASFPILECYEIYFLPNTCGNHWLNVSLNHIPILDNPCRLIVRPSSNKKAISASGKGLFHAYTGEYSCDGRVVKALD